MNKFREMEDKLIIFPQFITLIMNFKNYSKKPDSEFLKLNSNLYSYTWRKNTRKFGKII